MSYWIDELKHKYDSPDGRAWKDMADQIYPPSKAVQVFIEIFKTNFLSDSGDKVYTIMSPSCNTASHEVAIGRRLAQMMPFKSILMLCSDLVISYKNITASFQQATEPNLQFEFRQGDAFELETIFPSHRAHIIYDHKGALWHAATEGSSQDVRNLLVTYRNKLENNGIIVYDGMRRGSGANEWSTAQKITNAISQDSTLCNFLDSSFDRRTIGHGSNDLEILIPK